MNSAVTSEPDVEAELAHRFLAAWKRVERHLVEVLVPASGDMNQLLRLAERRRLLTPESEDFLQSCRRARNAYAHIGFDGYVGPVAVPPREVVHRLERLAVALTSPGRARSVASPARACEALDPVRCALDVMRRGDFSQVPYQHPGHGWVLFTREHVSAMVEAAVDQDGVATIDLTTSVVSAAASVGVVRPVVLGREASAAEALDAFERTLTVPDSEPGGYPALLLVGTRPDDPPSIITADDLPRLYDLLGR